MTPFEFDNLEKLFYEEKTNSYYKTLSGAKSARKDAYVYRVWISRNLLKKHPIFAYGESLCSIKEADKQILKSIEAEQQKQQQLF